VAALARKRASRCRRVPKHGSEPEARRSALGIVPFLVLITLLGVLAVAIMVLAFPGSQPQRKPTPPDRRELGVANRGWFQEAQKQFR